MTSFPTPYAAARIATFLDEHLSWSAWWDKRYGLWRVAEDDTDSDLYAESRDADVVIQYMRAHSPIAAVSRWVESPHQPQIHPGADASGRHRAYGDRHPPGNRGRRSRRKQHAPA